MLEAAQDWGRLPHLLLVSALRWVGPQATGVCASDLSRLNSTSQIFAGFTGLFSAATAEMPSSFRWGPALPGKQAFQWASLGAPARRDGPYSPTNPPDTIQGSPARTPTPVPPDLNPWNTAQLCDTNLITGHKMPNYGTIDFK